jgi:hypothetical protein
MVEYSAQSEYFPTFVMQGFNKNITLTITMATSGGLPDVAQIDHQYKLLSTAYRYLHPQMA